MAVDEDARSEQFRRLQRRLHLVETLIDAHARWDDFVQVVTDSEDTVAAVAALTRDPFDYDAVVAGDLLSMPISMPPGRPSRRATTLRDRIAGAGSDGRVGDPEAPVRSSGPAPANADPARSEPGSGERDVPIAFIAQIIDVVDVAAECDFYQRLGMQIVHGTADTRSVLVTPGIPLFGAKPVLFALQAGSGREDRGGDNQRLLEVSDLDEAINACRSAGIDFEIGEYDAEAAWGRRYLKIRTPDGEDLILERP